MFSNLKKILFFIVLTPFLVLLSIYYNTPQNIVSFFIIFSAVITIVETFYSIKKKALKYVFLFINILYIAFSINLIIKYSSIPYEYKLYGDSLIINTGKEIKILTTDGYYYPEKLFEMDSMENKSVIKLYKKFKINNFKNTEYDKYLYLKNGDEFIKIAKKK